MSANGNVILHRGFVDHSNRVRVNHRCYEKLQCWRQITDTHEEGKHRRMNLPQKNHPRLPPPHNLLTKLLALQVCNKVPSGIRPLPRNVATATSHIIPHRTTVPQCCHGEYPCHGSTQECHFRMHICPVLILRIGIPHPYKHNIPRKRSCLQPLPAQLCHLNIQLRGSRLYPLPPHPCKHSIQRSGFCLYPIPPHPWQHNIPLKGTCLYPLPPHP